MSKIKWLPKALDDIERLYTFFCDKNPDAASRAAATVLAGANFLKSAPYAGRLMPDNSERREWFMAFGGGAYVLRYMIEDEKTIVIIRVWHSRERRAD